MPVITERRAIVVDDLSKGLNTLETETRVPKGFYVDAQNMYFGTNKNPQTVLGLTRLNTTAVPSGNVVWFEPYTDSAGVTTYLVATSTGNLYRYTVSTDTWRSVLTDLSTTATALRWAHAPFRGSLWLANGTNDILKWDGTIIVPGGAMWNANAATQLVANMESTEDAIWSGGTIVTVTPKEGTQCRSLTASGNQQLTYAADRDFLTGILGAPNFDSNDDFEIWYRRTSGTGDVTLRLRFGDAADANHFQRTEVITNPANNTWLNLQIPRSSFPIVAGAPVWSAIRKFSIFLDTAAQTIEFDWSYWRYDQNTDGPPVGSLIDFYAQQLIVGGIATDLVQIRYSDAGSPDFLPAANTARFSGGRHIGEKRDQITALRAYFDELIVGKVNSAWTLSGTGSNVSTSALPLTIGIDSHRGIVETPWSLHFPFENNIFGARLTSRGLVSTNVHSLLQNIDGDNVANIVGMRHDRTHTIRWAFQETGQTTNNLGLIYDYQMDAWTSTYTPAVRYYTRGIVSGNRELLCAQYDGFIRRVDVGTTFDGTAITSFITLPWMQASEEVEQSDTVQWLDVTANLRGAADVSVDARFATEPHEFSAAAYTSYATIGATPDADEGFAYLGVTNRWMQLRLRATSNRFEILLPIVIHYAVHKIRV